MTIAVFTLSIIAAFKWGNMSTPLLTLGLLKLVVFDLTMFGIFVREYRTILIRNRDFRMSQQILDKNESIIMRLVYFLTFLTALIYLERILANDVVFKLASFIFTDNTSFIAFQDAHVILVTNTDFIGGLLQLYLSFWFGKISQRFATESTNDDDIVSIASLERLSID